MVKHNLLFVLLCFPYLGFSQVEIHDLKLEYRSNLEGVDVEKPRFFWKLKSKQAG